MVFQTGSIELELELYFFYLNTVNLSDKIIIKTITITTDNGQQLDCAEFQKFAAEYQFEHVKTSQRYPQSNGKAENSVKIAKNILKKAADASHDPHLSLLDFWNTPSEGMDSNPAQCLFSSRARTSLPMAGHLLQPKVIPNVYENLQQRQNKQALSLSKKVLKSCNG